MQQMKQKVQELMRGHADLLEQFKKFLPEIVRFSPFQVLRLENKIVKCRGLLQCKEARRGLKY